MGTEIELKLAAPAAAIRNAASLSWLKEIAAGAATQAKLQSIYFDTPKCALRDHGVSLRVRNTGSRHLQTIKSAAGTALGRNEWEQEIEGDKPRLDLAEDTALGRMLTGKLCKRLQPIFETNVDRVTMPVRIGESEFELAFDTGEVRTPNDQCAPIAEIEIELKRGNRRDAVTLLRELARKIELTYAPRTKAERGYALLDGDADAPVKAGHVPLAEASTAAAFAQIGLECLRQVGANEAAVRREDPEGVHQMRIGLRRLRAALSLFKDMVRGTEVRRIKGELKWLTEQLGPARDRDVFLTKTVAPFRSAHQDQPEFALLEEDAANDRRKGFARARAAVESERFRHLLLDVTAWLLDGDWRNASDPLRQALRQRPIADVAARELKRRTRKIVKRIGRLERLDAVQRHKLRIAVKKLRYGREFFAELRDVVGGGRRARRFNAALKRMQSALGDLNDMRVHAGWSHDVAGANAASEKAIALGYLVGCEAARIPAVLDEALVAGKRLKRVA
ncbi:putative CHAD domain containing protein [Bradyrhizobium sp. STM 3843]|uniref:CYTH and CHAD domain-containing protein n=1 Tax=Bradyrhizobium sp. STM 3843 TaxID=551947 RepID=UPI000240499B|nr:CYTH and CHAD domain-containing protein [Bradyrhizobium sp. STM 3843]CCE09867.1 putative CHAD domain containing protein [Bradyrhizobium sp. STM 3843]